LLAVLGILVAQAGSATILTFDTTNNIDYLPAGYGDNIDQSLVGGFTYLEGAGFTPDISIDFLPDSPYGPYTVWSAGYAFIQATGVTLLPNALGHQSFNVPGEIVLSPSNGAQVFLHGFDIGTYGSVAYSTEIRIWDDNGSRAAPNLFAFSQELSPSLVYQPLAGVIEATGALHIFISNLGSTGIDNLHFAQVPEPHLAMLLALAAGVGWRSRRR
jgi:hypothetical protein